MKLYNYFRSSASYRVRIALALKGLSYEYVPVHLVKNEQLGDSLRAPCRRRSSCRRWCSTSRAAAPLTQSLAIIEYLDETPSRAAAAAGRRRSAGRGSARIALDIACEIHPLNNLRVLRYLVKRAGRVARTTRTAGTGTGSRPGSRRSSGSSPATRRPARFCHGDTPGLADCVLVPQIFNAQRMDCRARPRADGDARLRALHGRGGVQHDPAVRLPGRGVSRPAELAGAALARATGVGALMTTRDGGDSAAPFATMNLRHGGRRRAGARSPPTGRRFAAASAPRRCSCARCTARGWSGSTRPMPGRARRCTRPTPASPPSRASPARCRSPTACRCCSPRPSGRGVGRRPCRLARPRRRRARSDRRGAVRGGGLPARTSSTPGSAPASGRAPSRSAPTCSKPSAPRAATAGSALGSCRRRRASGWPTSPAWRATACAAAGVERISAADGCTCRGPVTVLFATGATASPAGWPPPSGSRRRPIAG